MLPVVAPVRSGKLALPKEKEVGIEYELLRRLKDLTSKVETGIEAKKKLEEQVHIIEDEVKRLREVAKEELKKMGVFSR